MFTKIKLALKIVKALGEIAKELKLLRETLTATTILLNTKPVSLDRTLTMDKMTVEAPLLYDLLASRQDHQTSEIVDFKTPVEIEQDSELLVIEAARKKFTAGRTGYVDTLEDERFRAWRS